MEMGLNGRTVIITGASRNIGRRGAELFAEEGCNLAICTSTKMDQLAETAAECEKRGASVMTMQVDVSNEGQVNEFITKTAEKFGRIDVLVNNAVFRSEGDLLTMDVENWKRNIEVNIDGPFYMCRAAVPYMIERKWGRIINFSSAVVPMGRPNYLHYVSSKAGVQGLSRAMAREVGDFNITVNAILPGATVTEVARETVSPEQMKAMIQSRCIKRPQEVSDLTGVVGFLCSKEADFITGQSFVVDGGLTVT